MYTPLAHLTLDELVSEILNAKSPTWHELELCSRIEQLQDEIDELTGDTEFPSHKLGTDDNDSIFGAPV